VGEDRARDSVAREPAELRPHRGVPDQRAGRVPPDERARQRRAVPDVEIGARQGGVGILEGDDVAGVDIVNADRDPRRDRRTADRVGTGEEPEGAVRRSSEGQDGAVLDRQAGEDLVGDRRRVDRRPSPPRAPRVIRVGVRRPASGRIFAASPAVLAEIAQEANPDS
jgi:hypothetical protein